MKLLKLIIGITLGVGLTLSSAANTADTANIKQRVKIKPFHSINIATVGRVTIKQGPKCTMKISGSKRLMNLTKFNVEDGELSVYFAEGIKNINTRNEQIKIIITAPKLNRIDFSGVGQLTCDSTIRLDNDIYIYTAKALATFMLTTCTANRCISNSREWARPTSTCIANKIWMQR